MAVAASAVSTVPTLLFMFTCDAGRRERAQGEGPVPELPSLLGGGRAGCTLKYGGVPVMRSNTGSDVAPEAAAAAAASMEEESRMSPNKTLQRSAAPL